MASGKRLKSGYELIDRNKTYTVDEAAKIIKEAARAKFDETIEISVNLGVDPRHADQMVRGSVAMPNGTGKTMRVAVFARDAKAEEAKSAGAEFVGAEDLAELIQNGEQGFDRVIASPDMMGVVGRLGKVLGPRGLMPNPKSGTVTNEIGKAITDIKKGKIDFKVDKNGIVHASIGKVSFDVEKISENAEELLSTIKKLKPSASKGTYIKSISISSTMGHGVSVESSSFNQ